MTRWRRLAAPLFVAAALAGAVGTAHAAGPVDVRFTTTQQLAPGVVFRSFEATTGHGSATGYVVSADLDNPHVGVDLLHPGSVADRAPVSQMMRADHAIAGTNGDFFNISETHTGVAPTNSSDGPEIADGVALKANVPDGQRFGPGLPAGTTTHDVFGVGVDHRARLGSLTLTGQVRAGRSVFPLGGFNQYALPVNGIGVYTDAWGTASRVRPTCGTDTNRAAPCTTDTEEVTVRHGVVVAISATPGTGAIPPGTDVLVGRETGADELRGLVPGEHVTVHYGLGDPKRPRFRFAVGGFPILRNGTPLTGLDDTTLAPRASAGASANGRTVYLVALDGRSATSAGMTVNELALLLADLGAANAVNLDGGGSAELATRGPDDQVTVRNSPSDGAERPVANGIAVVTRP
ncbi:MAG TPA: phosphodiester glycosidase family protein [Pseudonocardiaceae bacterium]|nr:phosphodiester glycosidase family protein [Pseudonocardiaceae bacterium]